MIGTTFCEQLIICYVNIFFFFIKLNNKLQKHYRLQIQLPSFLPFTPSKKSVLTKLYVQITKRSITDSNAFCNLGKTKFITKFNSTRNTATCWYSQLHDNIVKTVVKVGEDIILVQNIAIEKNCNLLFL